MILLLFFYSIILGFWLVFGRIEQVMNAYCQLAKKAVESFVEKGIIIKTPGDLPEEILRQKAGVFVTIKKQGALRGCMGTAAACCQNIAQEIIENAIAAASRDYRFSPITKQELAELDYEVSVLGGLEPVKNISQLNPKKYGILIRTASPPFKSGLLLPDLKGIDTTDQQLTIACRKAGINPQHEQISIYRFEVKKRLDPV